MLLFLGPEKHGTLSCYQQPTHLCDEPSTFLSSRQNLMARPIPVSEACALLYNFKVVGSD